MLAADRFGSRLGLAIAAILGVALGSSPVAALVSFDLHYQGRNEIELSELPADGRITLDLDVSWDGELPGLVVLGAATLFDPLAATFVSGTRNKQILFYDAEGGDALTSAIVPAILRDRVTEEYKSRWPLNEVDVIEAVRFPGGADYPGQVRAAASLTFDVHDVVTFKLGFGQGNALMFMTEIGGSSTSCSLSGVGETFDASGCVSAGLVAFDGFRVVDRGRVAAEPTQLFAPASPGGGSGSGGGGGSGGGVVDPPLVPEPGSALLIGLGIGLLGSRRRG